MSITFLAARCSSDPFRTTSDYNFAPDGDLCVPVGPEPIPAGSCLRESDKFKGSSGFRLIPGNTCDVRSGIKKDAQVEKPCQAGKAEPGLISHQTVSAPPPPALYGCPLTRSFPLSSTSRVSSSTRRTSPTLT